jgi:predicted nucleotidyltransferase
MEPFPEIPSKIKGRYRAGLEHYITSLIKRFPENLVSVILYGSAARNEHVEGVSNLNILIVLKDAGIRQVRKGASLSRKSRKYFNIDSRFMSIEIIKTAGEILPIAFLDIKEKYIVLYGEDVLEDLDIKKGNLLHQCKYQLRFFMLRLRTLYLSYPQKKEEMIYTLKNSFTNLLYLLKGLHSLEADIPAMSTKALIEKSIEKFDLDPDLLNRLMDLKFNLVKVKRKEAESLYERYLDLLFHLIQQVDKLSAPEPGADE